MQEPIVWTVASELVARRGEHAVPQARRRSRELEEAGDPKGAAVWAQVAEAAERMLHPH
jgi:hypothetical protein